MKENSCGAVHEIFVLRKAKMGWLKMSHLQSSHGQEPETFSVPESEAGPNGDKVFGADR